MRGLVLRLATLIPVLAVMSQLAIPPYLEHRVAGRLTAHGGTAQVDLSAVPSVRLLFGHGNGLHIQARGLSVDLQAGQEDVFKRLDNFSDVTVAASDSRAGPFTVRSFWLRRLGPHRYTVIVAAEATAGDVARYAGAQLGGGFGEALAGLATSAVGAFERPVLVNARMEIDTSTQPPRASGVQGDVAGLPAGPLAGVVANALLGAF